jgi:zinc protease
MPVQLPATEAAVERIWRRLQTFEGPYGLTVLVLPDPATPLATTDVWIKTGSRYETPAQEGAAHFLEHVFFKGTATRGIGQVAADIEAFGGRTNAGTSYDFTHYYISCESIHIDKALEIHADVFRHSLLADAAIEGERSVILEEIRRAHDNPTRRLWDQAAADLFGHHPYGRSVLGSADQIAGGLRPDHLRSFRQAWYSPGRMAVIAAGNIDPEKVSSTLQNLYEGWRPPGGRHTDRLPRLPVLTPGLTTQLEMPVRQGYLTLATRTSGSGDWLENLEIELLAAVLGNGRTSRLSMRLKEELGLVTTIGAGHLDLAQDGVFLIRAECRPEHHEEVQAEIRHELRRLRTVPVAADELCKARDLLENSYLRLLESPEGLTQAIGHAWLKGHLDEEPFAIDALRRISPERLLHRADQLLDPSRFVTVFAGPPTAPRRCATQPFDATLPTSCRSASSPGLHSTSPDPRPSIIQRERTRHGIRLVFRHVPDQPLIGLAVAADAGSIREEPAEAGVAHLLAELFSKGTQQRSGQEFLWALETLGAQFQAGAEPDVLRLAVSCPQRNFLATLDLILELLQAPTVSSEAFHQVQQQTLTHLEAVADSPFEHTWCLFHRTLFGNHPYARLSLGTKESVASSHLASVQRFHARTFRPDKLTVALVGNIPDSLRQEALTRWEAWTAPATSSGGIPALNRPTLPTEPCQAWEEATRQQTMIFLGWLGPRAHDTDYPAGKVLQALLGGGMGSRLFRRVRNELGLAYSVSCLFPTRMGGGPFLALAGVEPGKAAEALAAITSEIAAVRAGAFSTAELQRAVSYVTGQFALEHDATLKQANLLAWYEAIGLEAEFDARFPDLVRRVTDREVMATAARHLDPSRMITATTGPLRPST